MGGSDWTTCGGEVFRIYRALGPGEVQVGDLVGLYYRLHSKWLGCVGDMHYCYKRSCPGNPSAQYGFQDSERWYRCYGEVFKIYARGKGIGDVIQNHDQITLFHVQQGRWLSYWMDELVHTGPCPGTVRPHQNYDRCFGEVFEVWKWH